MRLRYHRHSRRGEVDFIGETAERKTLPLEVKSGKAYKRHVALNNLLSIEGYGVEEAYVLFEANILTELRQGKPVHYVPLSLAPLRPLLTRLRRRRAFATGFRDGRPTACAASETRQGCNP